MNKVDDAKYKEGSGSTNRNYRESSLAVVIMGRLHGKSCRLTNFEADLASYGSAADDSHTGAAGMAQNGT